MTAFRPGDRVSYFLGSNGTGNIHTGDVQNINEGQRVALIRRDGFPAIYDTVRLADLTLIGVGGGGHPVDPNKPPSGGFDFGWAWPFIVVASAIGQAASWLWRNTFGRLGGRPMD